MKTKWMTSILLGLAFALAGRSLAAPTTPKTVDQIELVVDQDSMTQGEVDEAISTLFAAQGLKIPAPGSPDYEQAKKDVVEGFIREVLMAEEADREKIEVSDGDVDHSVNQELENMKKRYASEQEFEDALKKEGITQDDLKQDIHDQLLRRMKANRVLQMKQHDLPGTVFVTDEEVKKYFDQHPKDYEQAKFSLILFRIPPKSNATYIKEVEKQANQVLKELKAGADFAAYAKKYSEDEASAEKGGQMEPIYRVDLDPKLADGIFAIPTKGMGLVTTPDGLYIIKLEYKGTADYDSVAPDIKEHLRKQKQDSAFNQWIESLKKDAYIVEDGKEIAYQPPAAENTSAPNGTTATTSSTPSAEATTAESAKSGAVSNIATPTPESTPESVSKEIYPTLPAPGSLTLDIGAEGFSYGIQDLSNYYGPSVNTSQSFPFGFGVQVGLDFAIDPTIQLGLKGEGLQKLAENVNFTTYNEQWNSSALGAVLEAKILIPLDESTNFILQGGGGDYFLVSGSVTVSGAGVTENANFSGSNFGGEGGGSIEFFFDSNKDSALDLDAGYRYLRFQPLTSKLAVNTNGPIANFPSPLTNSDGSKAMIDFSGVHAGLSIRFYFGKGD